MRTSPSVSRLVEELRPSTETLLQRLASTLRRRFNPVTFALSHLSWLLALCCNDSGTEPFLSLSVRTRRASPASRLPASRCFSRFPWEAGRVGAGGKACLQPVTRSFAGFYSPPVSDVAPRRLGPHSGSEMFSSDDEVGRPLIGQEGSGSSPELYCDKCASEQRFPLISARAQVDGHVLLTFACVCWSGTALANAPWFHWAHANTAASTGQVPRFLACHERLTTSNPSLRPGPPPGSRVRHSPVPPQPTIGLPGSMSGAGADYVEDRSINRTGAVPTFLRTPTVIQPSLDMKTFLQFPMETAPPHSVGLFHNFNTSQAEAHYKGNRHARRVKGIETSKPRPQESDKPPPGPTTSPSPPGNLLPTGEPDPGKADETQLMSQLNRLAAAQGPVAMTTPATPDSPGPSAGSIMPSPAPALAPPTATSNPGCGSSNPEQSGPGGPAAAVGPASGPPETEEDKAKKLLYCSLCKVAVNSLSQLEAHNKGTKHKTILEARSGLGPIKAYPRLCPKPSGEQGCGASDPNTQERTFHCEICNVRVNSELQLKQHISSRRHRDGVAGKPNPLLSRHKKHRGADLADLTKALGAGLLPSPLAVAAAMAAAASSNPLALRAAAPAPHPHHHLLQGPPLSHAILRPAPGPIRTSHGPILFSPY
ncbi:LOW QUALITY PROTEIN: zinc finger protein 385A [Brachyhypopomus gauderio]|uniref:LOW QUALITY PROTEIN: zinc finger protein 385A n=1 Tax=Brachyhypopomus gauderio TaxID=698409 RepID=UPI004040FB34